MTTNDTYQVRHGDLITLVDDTDGVATTYCFVAHQPTPQGATDGPHT
jgi:hypothetical protein